MNGPDGVYLSDWHDTDECHNYDRVHPSGRIYKITYGKPKKVEFDLAKLSDEELVKLQTHKNEWHARQARRLLQEQANVRKVGVRDRQMLASILDSEKQPTWKLRALWAMHGIGGLDEK